jgi:hypothetical protein
MAGKNMMQAPDERISRVIAPLGAYQSQSPAERVDRVPTNFVDDALERRK